MFIRKLEIRRLELINLSGMMVGVTTSLLMAIWMQGPLPLILGPLVGSGITTFSLLSVGGWRPTLLFYPRSLRPMAGVALPLSGFGIVNYVSRNLDNLLIGKFFGPEPLAFYSRAYGLMLSPMIVNSALANTVTSVFARLQHDKPRCGRLFMREFQRVISFVSFPSMTGLCLVAEPFVLTVYGEKWLPMVPILRVLALAGLLQGTSNATRWILHLPGGVQIGCSDWAYFPPSFS